ncbi:MAG: PASTA domain-containing protein, partial [Sedimenticola sp.]
MAASARGTIVKIDTNTGAIKGEYYSAPNGRGRNPSRTTVDKNGNVWTGNRDEASGNSGSVVHVGLEENGECEDRNDNGIIDTSSGLGDILTWINSGGADNNGGVSTAADECVIGYVRVRGHNVRHVSVDSNNNVWVGGYSDHQFDLIDGETQQIIASANPECGGYGGLVDPNGVLWSVNRYGGYHLLRYDAKNTITTSDDEYRCIPVHDVYGLAFDQEKDIWTTTPYGDAVYVLDNDGNITNYHNTQGGSGDTGMAISIATDNNVWIANRWGASISRLDQAGNVVAVIPVGAEPTGVAVDGNGKVWAANKNSNSVSRIDPSTNAVDLVVDLGAGAGPYNYSDMTGSTLTGAPDKGSWSVVYDNGYDQYKYGQVVWNSTVPGDGILKVSISSSQDGVNFSATQIIESGKPLNIATGRYLKVDVSFVRSSDGDSPVLYDLSIVGDSSACNTTNGCNNDLPVADAGQDQHIFVNDAFQLDGSSSNDPDQDPISYQWSLVAKPENSTASLDNGTSPQPSTVADARGLYIYQLKVDDGKQTSLGDMVSVTVAQSVTVPDLAGLNQTEAEEAVTSVELGIGMTTLADSESVPKGQVVSQVPVAGTIVPVETSVNIVISRGAKPNITSTPPLQAWVSAEYTYDADATDPDGTVVT